MTCITNFCLLLCNQVVRAEFDNYQLKRKLKLGVKSQRFYCSRYCFSWHSFSFLCAAIKVFCCLSCNYGCEPTICRSEPSGVDIRFSGCQASTRYCFRKDIDCDAAIQDLEKHQCCQRYFGEKMSTINIRQSAQRVVSQCRFSRSVLVRVEMCTSNQRKCLHFGLFKHCTNYFSYNTKMCSLCIFEGKKA